MMYPENYGIFADLVNEGEMNLKVKNITLDNIEDLNKQILNLMLDSIETDLVKTPHIHLIFKKGIDCEISVIDMWINLTMWELLLKAKLDIKPRHIFFDDKNMTRGLIKSYCDDFMISKKLGKISNREMNNILDDAIYKLIYVDKFSWYLANTFNAEDYIDLEKRNDRFRELLHTDISGLNVEDVNKEGLKRAQESIDIMVKDGKHGFANLFRSGEGVNKKQYKEVAISIGTKPDGNGGIFPKPVNKSFLNGGVSDMFSHYVESSNGRVAQIIVENNVGGAGSFARILGLNNIDTTLHKDPDYVCDTKHPLAIVIQNKRHLQSLDQRYYRLSKNGPQLLLDGRNDKYLIGKEIFLYSPETCASKAHGHGICYRCYGKLAHVNNDISIGKLAAELVSSALTQKMLSAKHLLEAIIKALKWHLDISQFLDVEFNLIKPLPNADYKSAKLLINLDEIQDEETIDDGEDKIDRSYSQSIDKFAIELDGKRYDIFTEDMDSFFLSAEMADLIERKSKNEKNLNPNGEIMISLKELQQMDICLFAVQVLNNDLNATLEMIKATLDKKALTESYSAEGMLMALTKNIEDGGLKLNSVHLEVLISNQIRDAEDILEEPDWSQDDVDYKIYTLSSSLKNNPRITVSLSYSHVKAQIYSPVTYRKHKHSQLDYFFMEKPQGFLNNKDELLQQNKDVDSEGRTIIMKHVDNRKDIMINLNMEDK